MVGRRRCRRYRRCGCGMLPICGAVLHAGSAGRLCRAVGLLGRNMVLLRDLGSSIRGNARRLLHGLGIASADGRALCSCRTGRWRILRTARLLWSRTSSCGIADRCRTGGICRMGSWLFSCHAGLRRNWRRGMFCRRSLHKGTALLRRFCMRRLHLTFSCAADRLCRAARSGRRRCRVVWHCIWRECIWCAPLCVRRLCKGAALLRGFGLYRLSMYAAAVIRFSCRTGQHSPTVILHRRAAAWMGF